MCLKRKRKEKLAHQILCHSSQRRRKKRAKKKRGLPIDWVVILIFISRLARRTDVIFHLRCRAFSPLVLCISKQKSFIIQALNCLADFFLKFIYVINLRDLNEFKVELGVPAASLTPHAITKFRLWREIGVKVLSARAVRCFFFYVFNPSLYYFNNNTVFFILLSFFYPIESYPRFKEANKWREEKNIKVSEGFSRVLLPACK